jgi:transposase
LFGAINPRAGHRLVFRRLRQRQADVQAFLRYLRRRYPGRPLWLLLDKGPCHDAARSRQLAARLGIALLWLPKQCPELNAMDQLFKDLKRLIAANRQFRTIDEETDYAEHWILNLTAQQALRKASVLSDDFWLKDFLKNFWLPTLVLPYEKLPSEPADTDRTAPVRPHAAPRSKRAFVDRWRTA